MVMSRCVRFTIPTLRPSRRRICKGGGGGGGREKNSDSRNRAPCRHTHVNTRVRLLTTLSDDHQFDFLSSGLTRVLFGSIIYCIFRLSSSSSSPLYFTYIHAEKKNKTRVSFVAFCFYCYTCARAV